jgi:hypothetical protein
VESSPSLDLEFTRKAAEQRAAEAVPRLKTVLERRLPRRQ